jgi:hypothetical protein
MRLAEIRNYMKHSFVATTPCSSLTTAARRSRVGVRGQFWPLVVVVLADGELFGVGPDIDFVGDFA